MPPGMPRRARRRRLRVAARASRVERAAGVTPCRIFTMSGAYHFENDRGIGESGENLRPFHHCGAGYFRRTLPGALPSFL
ncbi:MAG: hypothetical protein DBY37_08055 [Desulfovibrionaceae bacterium]|nr:MAG: hypothetical protein DBY37_08055 [Desulfovibrionaceae bacterium]